LLASKVARLIDIYQDGAAISQLATQFGINRNAVTKILTVARVPLRSPGLNARQIDEAVRLYAVGQSLARIGDRFGVDAHTGQERTPTQARPIPLSAATGRS